MDRVLRSAILNSNVIDVIQDNKRPFDELMSKYRCAIMEIETKFKVLNEQYSLQYDRNPIETIKTRLKSMESISRKLAQKGKSFSAKSYAHFRKIYIHWQNVCLIRMTLSCLRQRIILKIQSQADTAVFI